MLDLLIQNASLPDGRTHMSVAVQNGKITQVAEDPIGAAALTTINATGRRQ